MDGTYIALYLCFQLLIGIYLSKFVKSENDFFLAGRSLPTFALVFSIFATWFGAETCIGSSAAVYANGLSGSKAEPLGYSLGLIFTGIFIAKKLWNDKYTTMGDFVLERYGKIAETMVVWIIIPSSLLWASAQIKAFGQVISVTTSLPVFWATTIATLFVITYTLMGGFLGDVVTDVLQGGILAIGLVVVLFFILKDHPIDFSMIDSSRLQLMTPESSFWERLDSWMIPIFGSMITQELIARILSAKDSGQAQRSIYGGTLMYFVFGSIPIVLGLIGSQFSLQLQDNEQFLPTLAKMVLPKWMFIIFAGALISAILSTIDSILLASSSLISHNFITPIFNIKKQNHKVLIARLVLVICGLTSYIMALKGESVYEMVELSSSLGTAGILVVVVGGLHFKIGNQQTAVITLILGVAISLVLDLIFEVKAAFAINLLSATAFFIIHGLFSRKKMITA
jgi:SSS family transporter